MRHFTQRLMMAIVATFMAVGSLWADELMLDQSMPWGNPATVTYNASAAGTLKFTITSEDSNSATLRIYYDANDYDKYYSKSCAPGVTEWEIPLAAGINWFYLSGGSPSTFSYVASIDGVTGGPTVKDPEPGDDPEHAIVWSAGSNSILEARTRDIWYKVNVAANSRLTLTMPWFSDSMEGYVGISDAESKSNSVSIYYDSEVNGNVGEYSNTGASAVDFYIRQVKYAWGYTGTASVTIESLGTLNNAKGIGTPAFSVANNANVAAATSSILVTFPNFQKGALADYNVKVFVNMSTGMTNIYSFTEFAGTANGGVSVPVSLESGKTYYFEVVMTKVDEYLFEYPETSIQFTAVSVADGSESNPYIITEAGVAGPDHGAAYGNWTWYKYECPSDGKVTISHTWANASVNTTGFIRVNGVQVASNVPNSWSQGCSAGDVIMVAVATESRTDGYLVKGSVAEPAEGETRETAKTLNVGNNTIAKVESGAMSNWYKFNLAANHEATLNFGLAIAAKYYVGSSVAGTNIENNIDGFTELSYVNDGTEAVDIYVEVTGTNDKTPVATLAIEELQASQAGSGTAADPYVIVLGEDMPCPAYGNTAYYVYTATEDGLLSMDNSQVSSSYPSFYYGSSASSCSNSFYPPYAMTTGQTVYISCNCYYDISSKTISFSFRAPEPGEVVSDPLILNEGSNTIAPLSGPAMWYKLTVPAKKTFSMNVPYGTFMYKGLTNATNESNGVAAEYNSGSYKLEGTNKETSSADFYFKVNSNYGDFTCNIVFADYEELDFSHVTGSGTSSSMYNVIVDKIYPGGATSTRKYYMYTATADCWFTIDDSHLSGSNYIYASTTKTQVTGSQYYNYGYSGGMQLNEGQSVYFRIEFYGDNSEKYVIFHAGEVPAGATPAKAHTLVEGNNNIEAINEWYSIAVPAGATLTFEPQAYMSYSAYAGIADANAQSNAMALTYNYSTYASDLNYTNETGAELNVYIKPTYYYGATNCVVTLDIPAPASFDITLTADGYASFCWNQNWVAPAGVTVYIATAQAGDAILIEEVSGTILAGDGVILYAPGQSQITVDASAEDATELIGNILEGTTTEIPAPAGTIYALHYVSPATVFDQYTGATIPANKAYLKLGSGAPARLRVAMAGNTVTGMENVAGEAKASKRLVDGQLIIVREGKMYNVHGAVVK